MPALENSLVALEEVVLEPAESPVPDGVFERLKQSARGLLGGSTLKAKVFRGGVWMGAGSFSEQVARFGRNMILTRLLAPEAFGTMAVVLSAGSLIQIVTEIGVKEAIIQNPRGTEDRYLSAAWWLAFFRSISIYAVVFLLAPWLSKFYGNHELVPLLRVVACGVIFEGTLSSKAYAAIKDMSFRKWALIHHGGGIAGVLITLILSLFIRDVWALVLGNLAESGMRCVLSYVYCPYLPLLSWDKEAARELLHFSRRLFGLSFLNLIFSRADVFVLAKLYSPAALGLYVMGIYLVQTPTGFLMNLLGQTLLPTFSKVQGEKARENRILLQVTALLVQLGLPTIVFIFFCGRSLLTLFYGQRYATAAWPLMIAAGVAFVNLLNGQITVVFYGRGEPQLHRRSVAIMAALMVVSIYPFARWFGLAGGQIACLLAVVTGFLFQLLRMRKLTDLSLVDFAKPFVYGGALALIVLAVALLSHLVPQLSRPAVNIVLGTLACATAYALCAASFLRKRGKVAI